MIRVAHRGASFYAVENSMEAFKIAVDLKVDYIEADVRFTKDAIPVVFHDVLLNRITNQSGRLLDRTYDDLYQNVRLKNGEPIPSLEAVCSFAAKNNVKLYLDVKETSWTDKILSIALNHLRKEDLLIGSFHSSIIVKVKKLHQDLKTVLIVDGRPLNLKEEILQCQCDVVAFCFDTLELEAVELVQKLNKLVFTWTLDFPESIQLALSLGVNGITSNRPDVIPVEGSD